MLTEIAKPTEAQAKAGNYKKAHIRIQGLDVTIETPRGRSRKPGWPRMAAHYGYIKRTLGADGDHVDVFIGPHHESQLVVVIDQIDEDGRFDEHKCMIGYTTETAAVAAYRKCYTPDWKVGPVTVMTIKQFKNWLTLGTQKHPIEQQVSRYSPRWNEADWVRDDLGRFAKFAKHSDHVGSGMPDGPNFTPKTIKIDSKFFDSMPGKTFTKRSDFGWRTI